MIHFIVIGLILILKLTILTYAKIAARKAYKYISLILYIRKYKSWDLLDTVESEASKNKNISFKY